MERPTLSFVVRLWFEYGDANYTKLGEARGSMPQYAVLSATGTPRVQYVPPFFLTDWRTAVHTWSTSCNRIPSCACFVVYAVLSYIIASTNHFRFDCVYCRESYGTPVRF